MFDILAISKALFSGAKWAFTYFRRRRNARSNAERERLIAEALDTQEGRTVLAQCMVEPIRRALEYQAVSRRLLMVDELPMGAIPRYERDVRATANIVANRNHRENEIDRMIGLMTPETRNLRVSELANITRNDTGVRFIEVSLVDSPTDRSCRMRRTIDKERYPVIYVINKSKKKGLNNTRFVLYCKC